MRTHIKNVGKALVDRVASRIGAHLTANIADPRTTPATKIGQLQLWHYYRALIEAGRAPKLNETGFRCFSQFEEDGLILFIMATLGIFEGVFLDIGSGDGVNSNCANLALNFGWRGTFIDGNEHNIANGRAFYERHPNTWAFPSKFVRAMIARENINQVLTEASVPPEIDFMSIDIDGNDYWIWDAILVTSPKVVIIETHIEFGLKNIVVPYDKDPIIERWSSLGSPVRIATAIARRIGFYRYSLPPLTAAGLRESVECSLRRLKTDWIDILLLHEPHPDRLVHPAEILDQFAYLRQRGLLRAFGLAGAWSGIGPLLTAAPELAQVVQTPENEWSETFPPDITYGALTAGSQNYFAAGIGTEAAVRRLRSALARRPNGVVIVSTTKMNNLRVLAEAATEPRI